MTLRPFATAVALLALAACGATGNTLVTTTELSPSQSTGYRKIAIIAMSVSRDERRVFDDAMVARLGAAGVGGIVGDRYIEDAAVANGIEPMQAIRATGADGVLYIWLRRGDDKRVDPSPGSWGWGGNQAAWYAAPGTTSAMLSNFEARLYDMGTQRMVWSGFTTHFYPKTLAEDAPGIADRIVVELGKRGLIRAGG